MIGNTRFEVRAAVDENGNVSAKVFGRCSYGQGDSARDAVEFVQIEDEATLTKLGKVLTSMVSDSVRDELNRASVAAAAKCFSVAAERGEI